MGDQVHMKIAMLPKQPVSRVTGNIKGKSPIHLASSLSDLAS